jgi:hypothetical protein
MQLLFLSHIHSTSFFYIDQSLDAESINRILRYNTSLTNVAVMYTGCGVKGA